MLFIAKLTLVLGIVMFLVFSGIFILYIRAYTDVHRKLKAENENRLTYTILKMQLEEVVNLYSKPVGFSFVWSILLLLVSLLSWLVA